MVHELAFLFQFLLLASDEAGFSQFMLLETQEILVVAALLHRGTQLLQFA